MNIEELENKFNETLEALKENGVSDSLTNELKSIHESIVEEKIHEVKPVHFCIDEEDVIDTVDMGSCAITITKVGAEWMTKGGYRVYTPMSNASLFGALCSYVESIKNEDKLEADEKEAAEVLTTAGAYLLNLPMVVFSDSEFALKIATEVVEWMKETTDRILNEPLKEDDNPILTQQFNDATIAFAEIKDKE